MTDADVIVVGGSASAVSAAWPIVEAGHRVLMLDQGTGIEKSAVRTSGFLEKRLLEGAAWREFLGDDFGGLGGSGRETPKMKVPAHQGVLQGFLEAHGIEAEGVAPVGSLARGGLSLMWGAGAYPYSPAEIADWPVSAEDMEAAYGRVAARIGISGGDDLTSVFGVSHPLQKPLRLHPTAERLLTRYEDFARRDTRQEFVIGRARNAVVTEALDGREPCALTGMCLWGCDRNAIYSADQEIDRLSRRANFRYVPGAFVEALEPADGGWRATTSDRFGAAGSRQFSAKNIVLAAGALGSTRLALQELKLLGQPVSLACHPAFAFALWMPSRLGAAWTREMFSLGQLAYQLGAQQDRPDVFGVIFSSEGILASDIVKEFPFSAPRAAVAGRALLPSVLLSNGYLPSAMSDCCATLDREGNRTVLKLVGGFAPDYENHLKQIARRLRSAFWRLRAVTLPGSFRAARLGSDGHFAGTLPLSENPVDGKPTCQPDGQLRGRDGLYVADGAALPDMPVKHPTFTIMANADRIGYQLAARLR